MRMMMVMMGLGFRPELPGSPHMSNRSPKSQSPKPCSKTPTARTPSLQPVRLGGGGFGKTWEALGLFWALRARCSPFHFRLGFEAVAMGQPKTLKP